MLTFRRAPGRCLLSARAAGAAPGACNAAVGLPSRAARQDLAAAVAAVCTVLAKG